VRDPRFDCDPLLRAAATARLSAALHSVKLRTAAAVVAAGQRSFATAILSDLAELDRSAPSGSLAASRAADARALTAIVTAWERGDDAAVVRAFEAWEASDGDEREAVTACEVAS